MAHCIAVTTNAIRVQLPGGAIYAPAMHEAAARTCARSDLENKTTTAFVALVDASVALLNSGNASVITLEMGVHDDTITAKVVGKKCTSPTKRLVAALAKLAAKKASSFETKSSKTAHTITFAV